MLEFAKGLSNFQKFVAAVAAGTLITLTTGVVCGRIAQRWGPVPDMLAAARRVETMPTEIGDWKMVKSDRMSDVVRRTLMCAGYVNRTYVDQKSGDTVSLAIIVGPSGPTAVHTPEICYSSQDYSIEEPSRAVSMTDSSGELHTFWRTVFRSSNPTADQLCVQYAWTEDGNWKASESPRFEFAGAPMLFKIQLAAPVPPGHVDDANPCKRFLDDLLRSGWEVAG